MSTWGKEIICVSNKILYTNQGPQRVKDEQRRSRIGPLWVGLALCLALTFDAKGELLHTIDFTGHPDGPATEWLEEQGFTFRLDAEDLDPRFENGRLVLQTNGAEGGLFEKSVNVPRAARIRIHWGVEQYPQGANWADGVNAVPIAVMTSFGEKEIRSGSLFAPDAPYFIGIFLGEHERADRAYVGKYYQDGGRYFCNPCGAPTGETIVTDFDLGQAFREQFPDATPSAGSVLPAVSRFGFQMNTNGTRGGAVAFLKRIEYYSD